MIHPGPSWRSMALLALAGMMLVGCASQDTSGRPPRPGEGIAEYRLMVDEALAAMQAALRSLDQVSAQPNRCPAGTLAAFSQGLERLEVDSIRLRARSEVLQARGDAYFEDWHENLARVEDALLRARIQERRPQLQESFARIKQSSNGTREHFKAFLSGLRKLQATLEIDPAVLAAAPTKEWIVNTRQRGQQVEQGITAIGQELDAMTRTLRAAETASAL